MWVLFREMAIAEIASVPLITRACLPSAAFQKRTVLSADAEIGKLADGAGGGEDVEIARARAQIKAGILMSLESTAARCEQLARQMIGFKRPIPIDETITRIDAVDGAAIRRVAERLLSGRPTITALGPVPALEDLEKLAAAPS